MTVRYAEQGIATLVRAKRVLTLYLAQALEEANQRFHFTQPDRMLRFPQRISLSEPPNFGAEGSANDLPAVFLSIASRTDAGNNLTAVSDAQVGVVVDVILGNPNRPLDDTTLRSEVYANVVADVIQTHIRARNGESVGVYAVSRGPSGALPGVWFDDQWIVRSSDSLLLWVRYARDTMRSVLPDEPVATSHLPLSAAGPLEIQDFGSITIQAPPYIQTSVAGPAILITDPDSEYITILGTDVENHTGSAPIALNFGSWIVITRTPNGLSPSYQLDVVPLLGSLVLEDLSGYLLVEDGEPLALEDA